MSSPGVWEIWHTDIIKYNHVWDDCACAGDAKPVMWLIGILLRKAWDYQTTAAFTTAGTGMSVCVCVWTLLWLYNNLLCLDSYSFGKPEKCTMCMESTSTCKIKKHDLSLISRVQNNKVNHIQMNTEALNLRLFLNHTSAFKALPACGRL